MIQEKEIEKERKNSMMKLNNELLLNRAILVTIWMPNFVFGIYELEIKISRPDE